MTGETYTVVFMDTGDHQPATSADDIADSMPGEAAQTARKAAHDIPSSPKPPDPIMTSQLAEFDEQISTSLEREPPHRTVRSKSCVGENAPAPPPPPPADGTEESFAVRKNRLDTAQRLLDEASGKVPTPRPVEPELQGPYFGIELHDLYVRDGSAVPPVLKQAATELRKRAHVEGIFRIPGRAHTVAGMVDSVDKGDMLDLEEEETAEIASFLKKFFALLPSSVIPGDLVDRFGETVDDARSKCLELRQLVDQALPPERAEVLSFTLDLLHDIMLQSDKNKMSSKNLATVFLPALFFSVQGEATSAEEIMKMAVLGKAVSATLAFMIENPELDPSKVDTMAAASSYGAITIPAGSNSATTALHRKGTRSGGSQLVRPASTSSPRLPIAKGGRRRSASELQGKKNFLPSSEGSAAKLSAESVLAAMRRAKDSITRRGGTFRASEGSMTLGRRGWLTMSKRSWYFLLVNDWLYWFKDEVPANLGTNNAAELASVLGTFAGHINMSRCNVVSTRQQEIEVIQPTGPNVVVICQTPRDAEEWLMALIEVSMAGYPLPAILRLPEKGGWVTLNGTNERMYLKFSDWLLVLSKDEQGQDVFRSVALEGATVAKGRTGSGSYGFVLADANERLVLGTHNPGAAREWVDAIRLMVNLSWCREYEPNKLPKKADNL